MTVRSRSWAGAVAIAVGVLLMVITLLTAKVENGVPRYPGGLLVLGVVLAGAGLGLIGWALAGAVRQIGAGEARLEARLRAEAEAQKDRKTGP
jgi:hypothetical protein